MIKKYPASEFIKMAMEDKGWNAIDLSNHSNINLKTISLLLNNKTSFTIKMDRLISPALGFTIGVLSSIEAQYLEWKNLQLENVDNIDIDDYGFYYRKGKKINETNFKKIMIKAENKVKQVKSKTNQKIDFTNFFYNYYLREIQKIKDNKSFFEFINMINKNNIEIFLFNNVNVRGMSKKNQSTIFIFLNKALNKTFDSFIITLTHELLHHINFNSLNDIKIDTTNKKVENENEEKEIDLIALDYMLNNQLNFIMDNELYNSNLDNLKEYANQLDLNWIYLFGVKTYKEKNYIYKNKIINSIEIDYGDSIWENKNI